MNIEVEQRSERVRSRRWVPAALAGVAVVAVGVITLGGGATSTSTNTTIGSFTDQPIEDQIPGFTGSLHATITVGRERIHVAWTADAPDPVVTPIDTRNMRFNADTSEVAGIDFISANAGNLRVGPPGAVIAIANAVTAFAWHDSDPSLVVMTRELGGTSVWFGELLPDDFFLTSSARLEAGSVVVGYGDWGVAVHGPPDADGHISTTLFDPDGAERLRLPGEVVATRPSVNGGVMVADRRTGGVSVTWQTGSGGDALYGVGDLLAVVWSDDLTAHAELRDGSEPGIDLLHVRSGDSEVRTFENHRPEAWDPSGRFLAAVNGRQLVVIDGVDGSVHEVGIPPGLISDVRFSS